MPKPDLIPSPRHSLIRRFWRIMRILVLIAITLALIAVVLVAQGDEELHIHMLIATALGTSFIVLVGGALMTLVFLSNSSGHDAEASDFSIYQDNDDE